MERCSLPSVSLKLVESRLLRSRTESSVQIVTEWETSEPAIFRSTGSVTPRTSTWTARVAAVPVTAVSRLPLSLVSELVTRSVMSTIVVAVGGRHGHQGFELGLGQLDRRGVAGVQERGPCSARTCPGSPRLSTMTTRMVLAHR